MGVHNVVRVDVHKLREYEYIHRPLLVEVVLLVVLLASSMNTTNTVLLVVSILVGWLIGLRDPTSFAQTHPPGFPGGMSWHLGQCSGMP